MINSFHLPSEESWTRLAEVDIKRKCVNCEKEAKWILVSLYKDSKEALVIPYCQEHKEIVEHGGGMLNVKEK